MYSIDIWLYTLVSVILVSLVSLIGIFTLTLKEKRFRELLHYFVAFSVGALFGDAFIHLIPEAYETYEPITTSLGIIAGILIFFLVEKVIHWRHCHEEKHVHAFAYVNLIGDALHNFIDGIVIATSFIVSVPAGIATTVAVVVHEIPQEIGDFAILLKAGMTKFQALKFNFLSALAAIVGAVLTLAFATDYLTQYLVPLAIGSFIYLAGSDLVPQLHEESTDLKHTLLHIACMALGVAIMLAVKLYFG